MDMRLKRIKDGIDGLASSKPPLRRAERASHVLWQVRELDGQQRVSEADGVAHRGLGAHEAMETKPISWLLEPLEVLALHDV